MYNAQAAFNRSTAILKATELADLIVEHVCKIGLYPDDTNVNNWANEVSAWVNKVTKYLSNMKGQKYDHALAVSTILDHVFYKHDYKSKEDLLEEIEHQAWVSNSQKPTDRKIPMARIVRLINTLVEASYQKHAIKPFLIAFSKENFSSKPRFD